MDRFEKNIQKKLHDFEVAPPAEMWDAIEARLPQKSPRRLVWVRIAAAAAILGFVALSATWFFNQLQTTPQLTDETIITPAADTPEEPSVEAPHTTDQTITAAQPDPQQVPPAIKPDHKPSDLALIAADTGIESIPEPDYSYETTQPDYLLPLAHATVELSLQKPEIAVHTRDMDHIIHKAAGTSTLTIAQTAQETPRAFAMTAYFAPQQAYRYQRSHSESPLHALENHIMTFSAGMHLSYHISNRWQIETGAGYSRIGQRIDDIAAFSHPSMMPLYTHNGEPGSSHPQSMNTSMGGVKFTNQSYYFADKSSARIATLKGGYDESNVNLLNKTASSLLQYFDYLEIPLTARYKLLDRTLNMYLKAGVSANFLLSGNVYLHGSSERTVIGESVGVNTFNWAAMGGLAFSYPLTHRIRMNLEPTVSMFVTPMGPVKNLTKETYPYSYSVSMGLSYSL